MKPVYPLDNVLPSSVNFGLVNFELVGLPEDISDELWLEGRLDGGLIW